ncbi:MAG: isoamylase early set domain-containing protein [Candidatus Krumholzibacteria bacterium]|nr:isoamylase early set domain-containing protein [Candidatus Krumholzibacteria bacterium]
MIGRFAILLILFFTAVSCGGFLDEAVESPVAEGGKVTFRLKSPSARTVQLAADFNNWALGDAESGEVLVGLMERLKEDGTWEITLHLKPGRYRYRFLVNESTWVLDPGNPRVVDDIEGGKVNLLIIP